MRNNSKVQTLLIILVLALGLGYAYINSDLNINGTAQVNSANWDVHWANVQVSTGSVSASSPTISNQTTVNYSVVLDQPGDYYEFTVDAVNGGTIDAMIDSIDSKLNGITITTLPDYLSYTVTYEDGTPLEPNQQLLHNTTEKYKVRIEYNDDIELNRIPASNQTLNLQFAVTYRQANEDATEVPHPITVYTTNLNGYVYIGQRISNTITQFNNVNDALNAYSSSMIYGSIMQIFLKHITRSEIVEESYASLVITPEDVGENSEIKAGTYSLRGGDSGASFEKNKSILRNACGSNHCWTYYTYDTSMNCSCSDNENSGGLTAYADYRGVVSVYQWGQSCYVEDDGMSECGPAS